MILPSRTGIYFASTCIGGAILGFRCYGYDVSVAAGLAFVRDAVPVKPILIGFLDALSLRSPRSPDLWCSGGRPGA